MESAVNFTPAPVFDESFLAMMKAHSESVKRREEEHKAAREEALRLVAERKAAEHADWEEMHSHIPALYGSESPFTPVFAVVAPWYEALIARLPVRLPTFFEMNCPPRNAARLTVRLGKRTWQFYELFDGSLVEVEVIMDAENPEAPGFGESHAVIPPPELAPEWIRERLQFAFSAWLTQNAPEVNQDELWQALDRDFPPSTAFLAFLLDRMASLAAYLAPPST